jgi:hypothetical protein
LERDHIESADAVIEFIFDDTDPRCVKDEHYWYEGKPPKARSWYAGIKNSSTKKSADEVVVIAKDSWFVENTIAMHVRSIANRQKSPVIFSRPTLEPGAEEFVPLFRMEAHPASIPGDVFKRTHEFVLEARARDVQTVRLTLVYEPTEPFATIKRKQ